MFDVLVNHIFKDGTIKYKDEYGNTIFIRREADGDSFTAKLRFSNKNVKAEANTFHYPFSESGVGVHLEYLDGENHKNDESVREALQGYNEILQRWLSIMVVLKMVTGNDMLLKAANPDASEEDISRYKMEQLAKFEEFREMVEAL